MSGQCLLLQTPAKGRAVAAAQASAVFPSPLPPLNCSQRPEALALLPVCGSSDSQAAIDTALSLAPTRSRLVPCCWPAALLG